MDSEFRLERENESKMSGAMKQVGNNLRANARGCQTIPSLEVGA